MEETPAFLRLVLHSDEYRARLAGSVPPLVVHLTVGYSPELAKLKFLQSIEVQLEDGRRQFFVWAVGPAPGAVATSCHCFTLDGKPYNPAEALRERVDRFKVDVALLTEFMQHRAKGSAPAGRAESAELRGFNLDYLILE